MQQLELQTRRNYLKKVEMRGLPPKGQRTLLAVIYFCTDDGSYYTLSDYHDDHDTCNKLSENLFLS